MLKRTPAARQFHPVESAMASTWACASGPLVGAAARRPSARAVVGGVGGGGGGGAVVVVVVRRRRRRRVVVVVSTGTVVVVGRPRPSPASPSSLGGMGRSTTREPGRRAGQSTRRRAASARPSVGWTPTRPKTPTATAKPMALDLSRPGAPRRARRCALSPDSRCLRCPKNHRLPGGRWRAQGEIWATSAIPGPRLEPAGETTPRQAVRALANDEKWAETPSAG